MNVMLWQITVEKDTRSRDVVCMYVVVFKSFVLNYDDRQENAASK